MFPVLSANSPSGYNINNSLRFRSSATAYLSRTFSTSGTNNKIQTFSAWVKRGLLSSSANYRLMGCYNGSANYSTEINFSNDFLRIEFGGSSQYELKTTQVFRDPSAWYHIVLAIDTTQATSSNRIKMYVNGSQITAFATANYPAQNDTSQLTSANANNKIGANWSNSEPFDGYMAEVNFIDGQALTPSSFGSTNATTGVWQPARYTGTYGTNGFYLPFSDIALTSGSNAGLGKDFSGNANYWNTNNISVTAGTTYDAMIDSPTLTSATVANYAVLNPLKINGSAGTFSNANLNVIVAGDSSNSGTMAFSSGKIYFEVQLTAATESTALIGIADSNFAQAVFTNGGAINYGYVGTGVKGSNGSYVSYGATYTVNDIIGVAADLDAGTLVFYKNGVSQGTAYTSIAGTFIPVIGNGNSGTTKTYVANFGQRPFAYTPPTGFLRLNTYNLPDSTIVKGNTVMDATTYTGDGATTKSITNTSSFKPDLIWVKGRSNTGSHVLQDSNRGFGTATKLSSNSTNAENNALADATDPIYGYVTTANSNGFTVNNGTVPSQTNNNGTTYVGWQWQAGQGTNTSNTVGSITSTVSVNANAGFSVVTYTGTGASATVGHGLGIAPKIIIYKSRSNAQNWLVNIGSITGTQGDYIYLNSTNGKANSANVLNPTSSVFGLVTSPENNQSGITFVTYCWAEIAGFSKFGSYTGNGSTDGSFVFTGFRPKWLMIKRSSDVGDWEIYDTSRSTYNVVNTALYANSFIADVVNSLLNIDILSNGFKLRDSFTGINASGSTYIYMAFAENPFKNANAR
jgi:hypothetical protein